MEDSIRTSRKGNIIIPVKLAEKLGFENPNKNCFYKDTGKQVTPFPSNITGVIDKDKQLVNITASYKCFTAGGFDRGSFHHLEKSISISDFEVFKLQYS